MKSQSQFHAILRVCFFVAAIAIPEAKADLPADLESVDSTVPSSHSDSTLNASATAEAGAPDKPATPIGLIRSRSLFTGLLPMTLAIGPQAGFTGARFRSSREYEAYTKPTSSAQDAWTAPSYGILATARWTSGFTLSLAPRYETYGVSTREETVSFKGNPFPHTLRASMELGYNVWPLIMGWGWFGRRQHAQFQAGTFKAFLDNARMEWTVDGEPYPNAPIVKPRSSHSGWLFGTEYGYKVGGGELLVGVEFQQSSESVMDGLEGSIIANAARVQAAYLWTLMTR